VDFTEIMSRETSQAEKEDQFALEALRKIPAQYSTIIDKWIRYVFGETDAVTPSVPKTMQLSFFEKSNNFNLTKFIQNSSNIYDKNKYH
jgi:hypothetical protein